ncbi:membrane transporter protein, putative [Babesia caballi]|uniref:Membrane transporter protein, putative n=1 Tax=Babesia caballi TaxID=5871 RepID=A0AAV4LYS5_BABCB|nr:membrane transporter protein, putative [Babesia caballi]
MNRPPGSVSLYGRRADRLGAADGGCEAPSAEQWHQVRTAPVGLITCSVPRRLRGHRAPRRVVHAGGRQGPRGEPPTRRGGVRARPGGPGRRRAADALRRAARGRAGRGVRGVLRGRAVSRRRGVVAARLLALCAVVRRRGRLLLRAGHVAAGGGGAEAEPRLPRLRVRRRVRADGPGAHGRAAAAAVVPRRVVGGSGGRRRRPAPAPLVARAEPGRAVDLRGPGGAGSDPAFDHVRAAPPDPAQLVGVRCAFAGTPPEDEPPPQHTSEGGFSPRRRGASGVQTVGRGVRVAAVLRCVAGPHLHAVVLAQHRSARVRRGGAGYRDGGPPGAERESRRARALGPRPGDARVARHLGGGVGLAARRHGGAHALVPRELRPVRLLVGSRAHELTACQGGNGVLCKLRHLLRRAAHRPLPRRLGGLYERHRSGGHVTRVRGGHGNAPLARAAVGGAALGAPAGVPLERVQPRRERSVDGLRHLRDVDLEPLLHVGKSVRVLGGGDEGDGQTLGAETPGAADPVQVGVGGVGHVVVDDDVDALHVNATAKQVSGDHDALVEVLELSVARNALRLLQPSVNGNRGEVALVEQGVERLRARDGLDENDDLVELQGVEQVVELAILVALGQLDVVLQQPVKRKLGLVVDEDLDGRLHEALAHVANVAVHGGGEEHDLLLLGGGHEDGLDVGAHVELLKALVALVEHKVPNALHAEVLAANESEQAAGGADQNRNVARDGNAAVDDLAAHAGHVLGETVELVLDLVRELAGVADAEAGDAVAGRRDGLAAGVTLDAAGERAVLLHIQLLEDRQDEHRCLAHTGLGLAQDVHAGDGVRNGLVLHLGGVLEAGVPDGAQDLGLQEEVAEPAGVDGHVTSTAHGAIVAPNLYGRGRLDDGRGNNLARLLLLVIHQILRRHGALALRHLRWSGKLPICGNSAELSRKPRFHMKEVVVDCVAEQGKRAKVPHNTTAADSARDAEGRRQHKLDSSAGVVSNEHCNSAAVGGCAPSR